MELIIIDDEALVLEGLGVLINVFNSSINIKCFNDVDVALLYVKNNKPDIIISDIQMPKIDGLELCRRMKKLCTAEIIIISGFEDFGYAKKAVELGVLSYVLKPINQKEFLDVLQIAITKIEKKKTIAKKSQILKSKVLADIANGFNNNTFIKDELAELNENQVLDCYTLAIMILDDAYFIPSFKNNKDFEMLYRKLYKIINMIVEKSSSSILFSEAQPGKFVFLCQENCDRCFDLLNEIAKQLKEHLEIGTTIGLSNSYTDLNKIFAAYNEAFLALHRKFLEGSNTIYKYNKEVLHKIIPDLQDKKYSYNMIKLNYYQNIFCSNIVNTKNQHQLNIDIELLFEDIKTFINNCEEACRFCEELLLLIIYSLFKTFEHNSLTVDDIIKFCNTIQLKKSKTLIDLKDAFIKSLKDLTSIIINKISQKSNIIIMIVDKLLADSCSSITLQSAADAVGLNPTYFSILFKQKSGKNFKDYVFAYKMNYAKQMLLDPAIKIYEISEKIGYPDSDYFSKVYKKHTGSTPTDYRNKNI